MGLTPPAAIVRALEQQMPEELSHFEYLVLAMLSEAPARTLQMSGLAQRTNATLPRLSHVVRRLGRPQGHGRELCHRLVGEAVRVAHRGVLPEQAGSEQDRKRFGVERRPAPGGDEAGGAAKEKSGTKRTACASISS